MGNLTSPIPRKFVVTLVVIVTLFVPFIAFLMLEFPARGPGVTPVEWVAALGMGAILAFAIGGTIWYQWKALRSRPLPTAAPTREGGGLERVAGLLGVVVYSTISIAMLVALGFAFTVRDKLVPGEFWIFLAIGSVVALATGIIAWIKWRAWASPSAAAPEDERVSEEATAIAAPRVLRVLAGAGAIGFILTGIVAFVILLIGGDVAVARYMEPPLVYIEWLALALIAFPAVRRLMT
ncbi:MAG: hypothetical protein P8090_19375 [Gammaproteobacteria bacterium]